MAKKIPGITILRGVESVLPTRMTPPLGLWRDSLDITVREQANREMTVRISRRKARELVERLKAYL